MNYYAGIGARATPDAIKKYMTELAHFLNTQKWYLRSGGAQGADKAFEAGAGIRKFIYHPEDWNMEAVKIARDHHPAWSRLSPYVQLLMARNAMIVLSNTLTEPVKFVVCWTPNGEIVGGTGHSLRIAQTYNVPIINFGNLKLPEIEEKIQELL